MTTDEIKKIILPACQTFRLRYVDVFGSIARNENNRDCDIELLIEFEEPIEDNISARYFGFLHFVEDQFHKKVDLLTPRSIRNPYLKDSIEQDRVRIYG